MGTNTDTGTPVVLLTGGLGNQLFQVFAGLSMSRTGNLYVDGSLGNPRKSKNGLPEIFQFSIEKYIQLLPTRKINFFAQKLGNFAIRLSSNQGLKHSFLDIRSLILNIVQSRLSKNYSSGRKVSISEGVGFDPKWKKPTADVFAIGYFQSFRWCESPQALKFVSELKLSQDHLKLKEFKVWANEESPLILHLRLGDYVKDKKIGVLDIKYYEEAVRELWKEEKYKKIWIFSDDPDRAKFLLSDWILEKARWITSHQDSAAITLEIMRYGTGYVISNSTFSWWGAYLSYSEVPKVIAPTPWFKAMPEPKDLIPGFWLRRSGWE